MSDPQSAVRKRSSIEPTRRRRRSTDASKPQSLTAAAIMPADRPAGMATAVAQNGGYGPQLVSLLQTHEGGLTVVTILREVECDPQWLKRWLRPPYFFLSVGWRWQITRVGITAMYAGVDPPKQTGAVSGLPTATATDRHRSRKKQ